MQTSQVKQQVMELLHPNRLILVKEALEKMGVPKEALTEALYGYAVGGSWATAIELEKGGSTIHMRGRKFLDVIVHGKVSAARNPQYRAKWRERIVQQVRPLVKNPSKKCSVKIEFFLSSKRMVCGNDIDNLAKLVLDSLRAAQVYVDDRHVFNLEATKRAALKEEKVHITVWEWRDPIDLPLVL